MSPHKNPSDPQMEKRRLLTFFSPFLFAALAIGSAQARVVNFDFAWYRCL
ncbi:hypothetical protein ACFQY0_02515 [Haloferula chungangensis]|uniref:Uncharacterized protein n=1 Tax=Haloferula chungangensis TaxID=1048331 RepID=A0ABW2L120_9BACT